jgi:NAD(P)-dependent dehydrogenase (short-subunit alcohol dehydrogenase family)
MDLKGRVVAVTGGGNGIGRALCERFAAEGAAHVAVLDLEAEAANLVAAAVGGSAHVVNVRAEDEIRAAVDAIVSAQGHIDLFCSNAGIIAGDGPTWQVSSASNETWQAMWEIHVMSHVWAARACLPHMIERGAGYFLNTASAAGLLNQIGDAAYSTTKHAAVGFAEALAITHGDDGVRVSCLCPQAVATRMIGAVEDGGSAGMDGVISPADVAEAVVKGLAEECFLILPHAEVATYCQRKTEDYDRWLGSMRKLRRRFGNPTI